MSKLAPKSFKNFSGGYTRENAVFSEKTTQFVGGSRNIDIVALEDDGYGFEVMPGNTVLFQITGESIIKQFTYDSGDDDYLLTYTAAGKVYEYNESTGVNTVIKSGLSTTTGKAGFANISVDQLVGDPIHMGFFCNGPDKFVYIKGGSPEVQTVNAVDAEGRTINSSICLAFDGRMWLFDSNRVHWSKQLDPFDFAAENDAGYKAFDSTIIGAKVYNGEIIVSTSNGFKRIVPDGSGGYLFIPLSGGVIANSDCICTHDSYALYFSGRELFPLEPTQEGTTTVKNSLSFNVNKDFTDIDKAQLIEVTVQGRNETWLHVNSTRYPNNSLIYIFRWDKGNQNHKYWLPPRIQQKITCMHVFKDKILSGTESGKVLEELTGDNGIYDGVFYPSVAITPKINFGNYSGKQQTRPILFVDNYRNNNFYVDYIINGDSASPTEIYVLANNAESLIWGSGNWGGHSWALPALNRVDLDKAKSKSKVYECSLQLRFKTKETVNDFSIHGIDLTRIKKKNK